MKRIIIIIIIITVSCTTYIQDDEIEFMENAMKNPEQFIEIITSKYPLCNDEFSKKKLFESNEKIIKHLSNYKFKFDYDEKIKLIWENSNDGTIKKYEECLLIIFIDEEVKITNHKNYFTIMLAKQDSIWCLNGLYTYNKLTAKYFGSMP